MNKSEGIQMLLSRRAAWDGLLAKVPLARMDLPGAAGDWSVKDITAHVTAYERWLADLLAAARGGELPPGNAVNPPDVDAENHRTYLANRDRPLDTVQQEGREIFDRLVEAVRDLPEEDANDPLRTAWMTQPFWGKSVPLLEAVAGEVIEHYNQHIPGIYRWLAKGRDAYQTVRSLRSVRQFVDASIPEDVLNRILQAGRWSGSSKNGQPWQFIVVRQREILEKLAGCGKFAGHLRGAALAIVIVTTPNYISGFDAGRAAQNMMLAAWSEGIGSCIASMHDEACAKSALDVPADKQVQVAISFGYPDPAADTTIDGKPRSAVPGNIGRRPLDELVFHEKYGYSED